MIAACQAEVVECVATAEIRLIPIARRSSAHRRRRIARRVGSRSTLARKLVPRSSMLVRLAQPCGGIERRGDDRDVTGAAAQMAAEKFAQRCFVGRRIVAQDSIRATSGCRRCRSRIAARDGAGTPAAVSTGGRARAQALRRCGSRRHRPAPRASGTSAPARRRSRPCSSRRRRARSRHGCRSRQIVAQEIAQQHARLGLGLDRCGR